VSEAAAVGVPDELKGEAVVCFVVLRPGTEANDALRREILAEKIAARSPLAVAAAKRSMALARTWPGPWARSQWRCRTTLASSPTGC